MALCQEADVRRNHEFFNGRNAARTPLSTVGHLLPLVVSPNRSSERQQRSVTCHRADSHNSANADPGPSTRLGQQCGGYLPHDRKLLRKSAS